LDVPIVERHISRISIECLWLVPQALSSEPFSKLVSNFRIREAPTTIVFSGLCLPAAEARLDAMQAMEGYHIAVHLSIETVRWQFNLDDVW
jgi:hypothetical protein